MNRRSGFRNRLVMACTAGALGLAGAAAAQEPNPGAAAPADIVQSTSKAAIDRLIRAYPDALAGAEDNALVWKDGTRMTIDDGKGAKDFTALLATGDIKDMFYAPYPAGEATTAPALNMDPGRVRHAPFFNRMYGDCRKGEAQRNLVEIVWLAKKWGHRLRVTRINGVAARLEEVSRELDQLPARFDTYLYPAAGTFNCRTIAQTDRLSAHGHGIAIDIATRHADYWLWSKRGRGGQPAYANKIPYEIVRIFEKHGFIWGGKWYHYDTMHFEYRPELLGPE